jgi:hypothetical protein
VGDLRVRRDQAAALSHNGKVKPCRVITFAVSFEHRLVVGELAPQQ